jgi:hypothetical protein
MCSCRLSSRPELEDSRAADESAGIVGELRQIRQRVLHFATVVEALGDTASANLELASARETFARLGALPDEREAAQRLSERSPRRTTCTFMFTDIVDSTKLLTTIGDDAWRSVREWHDRTLGSLVNEYQGRVVKGTGDDSSPRSSIRPSQSSVASPSNADSTPTGANTGSRRPCA